VTAAIELLPSDPSRDLGRVINHNETVLVDPTARDIRPRDVPARGPSR
jgi:hypothetical protein